MMKLHRTVVVFSALAVCFALTAFFRFPILAAIASITRNGGHGERLEAFDSAQSKPIGFHRVPADHNQRIKLAFRFRANTIVGAPNLVQTADGNRGLRFELAGPQLVAVYPGRVHEVTRKVLTDQIQAGQWYDVSAEYESNLYVRAQCSVGKPIYESRVRPIDTDGVVIGRGFNESHSFDGQIRDFSIQATPVLGFVTGEAVFVALKFVLIALGGLVLWRLARSDTQESGSPIASIDPPAMGPIDPLLTLRSFALLQVLVGHLFMCVFVSYRFPGRLEEDPWLRLLAPAPWAGVWVFFTLSGYLMGKGFYTGRYTLSPQSVFRYLTNRFLRIAPVYWTALLALAVVNCPEIFQRKHIALLGSMFMFDYNGQERINPIGCLWSITTEVQFYALVPVLFWALSRLVGEHHQRALKLSGTVLVAGLVARLLIKEVVGREGVNRYIYTPVLANLDVFVLGMLANPAIAALRSKAWVARLATVPNALLLIGIGYVVSSYFGARVVMRDTDIQRIQIYGPTFIAMFTVLVIGCCELGSYAQAKAGLVRRVLLVGQTLGILAYAIYVWHEPILYAVRKLAPTPLTMGDAIKFGLVATFLSWTVAEFIYRTIELPTEKLKKKTQTAAAGKDRNDELLTGEAAATILLPSSTTSRANSKAA